MTAIDQQLETLDEERASTWVSHLLRMGRENLDHRRILELEGLRAWKVPELSGYDSLFAAMDALLRLTHAGPLLATSRRARRALAEWAPKVETDPHQLAVRSVMHDRSAGG